ncbi:hypothetical protein V5O48_007694 [Marasmius crinis-equi]|uniref:Uncharacterized protein n=1 Tax=Marasmius crinis-equi TaxID=585013 RepID=A0ABR3FG26_9AGAR
MAWTRLWSLNLKFSGPSSQNHHAAFETAISKAFETITTPALTNLSVSVIYMARFRGLHNQRIANDRDLPFHDLLLRSECQIANLHLCMLFDEARLGKTLDLISPTLKALTVDIRGWNGYFNRRVRFGDEPDPATFIDPVQKALVPSGNHVACPNLARIHFKSCILRDCRIMVDLIERRSRATRIDTFKADFGEIWPGVEETFLRSALESAKSRLNGVKVEWDFWMVQDEDEESDDDSDHW